ncbi:NDR1/HIN1-like protein 6 [Diospyros lotus]|uniref:NDR1/HIN1-like protein 6 n=1 Tax=Diospyros lotus TaxID=55363 RepID=UPI002256EA3A|nr:NDR1/HIN1-like protein 6 [Diospyros lotus]
MADHQRIHPANDVEAPQAPTAPLVARGSSKSDKGDPVEEHPHPPFGHAIPPAPSKPPKKRSCCCKCLCWTICLLILFVIIIGILVGIFFLVFRPKIPKYSIDSLRTTQFTLSNNMSLYASFDVNITSRNPNKKIGIYYEGGSHIKVYYTGIQLCQGSLPKFYQGHRNTTVITVTMTGQTQNATDILQSLQAQQQTGSIPLYLRAKVPVKIKLGSLKLPKWKFSARCNLVVDSLDADNTIRIRSSSCKFRLRL